MRATSALRGLKVVLAIALCAGSAAMSDVAFAQEEIEVEIAPPAARVEVIPVAPSPRHFWIHGYYSWGRGVHYWVPGHYDVLRPGWAWAESRWAPVGRRWHFYPGHWYH